MLYIYPMTGQPGVDLPEGWNSIPGRAGAPPRHAGSATTTPSSRPPAPTPSTVSRPRRTDYQAELAERLGLPFEILSDTGRELAEALDLPTFTAGDQRLYRRLTLVIADGRIEHVFYPIFPPDEHAGQALAWLSARA